MVFFTFGQGIAHVQDRHQVVDIAVDALSHARILDTNAEKQMRTAGSMLLPRAFLRLPGSSWPLLCRPSAWPGGPARWTPLRRDAPQTCPACPSSWDPDRCSTLSANTHKMVCFGFNINHSGLVHGACGRNRKTYCHLFDWHEVSTLSDAIKDLGKLRVDESVI